MPLLSKSARRAEPGPPPPLRGAFTVDKNGVMVISALPQRCDPALLQEIGLAVISAFRQALAAHLPLTELDASFGSLHIAARELKGGALVFLTPAAASPRRLPS